MTRIEFDRAAAAHLFRRAGFGASRATLAAALEAGLDATVEDLLGRRTHDPALFDGVQHVLGLGRLEPLQAWWFALLFADRAPLLERVTLLWHDHFATSQAKVQDVRLMHGQLALFRSRGLGDFRELLHAVARDPAMLVWLDGNANRRGEPNENFAREVLELFGLGIGNYDEQDVAELARAFTGWGVERRSFVVRERDHDPGAKTVFGHTGPFRGEDAVDLVLAHPACARHVARRLLAEFVHPRPDPEDVERWAQVLVEEDWSVERVLGRLLRSELFFSPDARRSRIAGPVEWLVGTALSLGLAPAPAEAARAAADMGQALLLPPSVKGWDGGRTWIHAGTWLARVNLATELAHRIADGGPESGSARGLGATSRSGLVPAALAQLLPDGAAPALAATLARAEKESASFSEATGRVLTLLLTAPETHLV